MRTRTFIGLILLVLALMVASTPELLTPAAKGAEAVLAQANMPGFTEQRVTTKPAKGVSAAEPATPVLELKGHAVEEDGDLRDRFSTTERNGNPSGRLDEGRGRRLMPGQEAISDGYDTPAELQDGVLLDNGGCPVFGEGSNVAAIWADADRRALYESKAAAADDPAGCAKVLTARRAEADATNAWMLPGDRRDTATTLRGRTSTVALTTSMGQLYEDVFGDMSAFETAAQDSPRRDQVTGMRRTNAWLIGSTALLALALGLLAAMNPAYGLGGLVVVLGLAAFLRSGAIAVCGFAATTYFEIVGAYLGESLSPIKIAGGALIVFAALSLVLTRRGHGASSTVGVADAARSAGPGWREHPVLLALLVGFVAWALTSAAWATNVEQVRMLGTRLVTDALIFLAIPVFLHTTRQLRALGWTILGGGVASVALGTLLGANLGGRAIGTFADPNEYAAALVASTAIGLALAETAPTMLMCWIGRAMSVTCLLGVIQSGSRGGLLAVFVAFFVLLLTARGRERVRMTGGLLVALATGAAWLGLTPNGSAILARVTDPDSSGRSVLWRVAVRMYEQNPVTGVGLGNYPVLSRHYLQGDIEHLELFLRAPRVVHSTPLELLAELGTIGALLYYGFVMACLLAGHRALRLARRAGRTQLVGIVRGVFAAACAMLATTIFLSGQYQELTWVLLATCVSALAVARRSDLRDAAATALESELVADQLELEASPAGPGPALLEPIDPQRPTVPA